MPDEPSAVGMERKLAAIFSTDATGYSRLMGDDEEATIRTLTQRACADQRPGDVRAAYCGVAESGIGIMESGEWKVENGKTG